jgi:hypothetical protein
MPIEFIVIAAITIVVLVVVSMMFISGSSTPAFDQQSVANNCKSDCFMTNQYTNGITKSSFTSTDSGFCSKSYYVKGMGTKNCTDIVVCELSFSDGQKCTASCNANKIKC